MHTRFCAAVDRVGLHCIRVAADVDGIKELGSGNSVGCDRRTVGWTVSGVGHGDDAELRAVDTVARDRNPGRSVDQDAACRVSCIGARILPPDVVADGVSRDFPAGAKTHLHAIFGCGSLAQVHSLPVHRRRAKTHDVVTADVHDRSRRSGASCRPGRCDPVLLIAAHGIAGNANGVGTGYTFNIDGQTVLASAEVCIIRLKLISHRVAADRSGSILEVNSLESGCTATSKIVAGAIHRQVRDRNRAGCAGNEDLGRYWITEMSEPFCTRPPDGGTITEASPVPACTPVKISFFVIVTCSA